MKLKDALKLYTGPEYVMHEKALTTYTPFETHQTVRFKYSMVQVFSEVILHEYAQLRPRARQNITSTSWYKSGSSLIDRTNYPLRLDRSIFALVCVSAGMF